jgi:hypothetical protein
MTTTNLFLSSLFLLSAVIMLIFTSCSKENTSGLDEMALLEVDMIDPDLLGPVTSQVYDFPDDIEITLNGQDYLITLSIDEVNPEIYGTTYTITMVLCNRGNQGIDDFRIELLHNRTPIYDDRITAFSNLCMVYYATNLYQGSGRYEARIILPNGHSDFDTTNNSEVVYIN